MAGPIIVPLCPMKDKSLSPASKALPTTSDGAAAAAAAAAPMEHGVRPRRIAFVLSALVLCTMGLLVQMHNLEGDIGASLWPNMESPESSDVRLLVRDHDHDDHYPPHMGGDFFVPSLDFRVNGKSAYRPSQRDNKKAKRKQGCTQPIRALEWEWFEPSSETTGIIHSNGNRQEKTKKKPTKDGGSKRLLIGLYAGYDQYAELLDTSAHLAKVYAQRHAASVSVVVLQGTAFAPQGCSPPGLHTTLNKLRLLFHAIDHADQYDQVLLLDADALLSDMDTDLTALLPSGTSTSTSTSGKEDNTYLLAAQPIRSQDGTSSSTTSLAPHKINAGATLWNLRHRHVKDVALAWFEGAKDAVLRQDYRGDQRYLQQALERQQQQQGGEVKVQLLQHEFNYSDGTIVKHFLQHSNLTWQERKTRLQQAAVKVCEQYPQDCEAVPRKVYPTE